MSRSVRFQSAPGGGAGGNYNFADCPALTNCFNPPPAVGPGETRLLIVGVRALEVSIRPRRWGRGKRQPKTTCDLYELVSIRPRRWGRGKRLVRARRGRIQDVSIRPRRWGRGKQPDHQMVNRSFVFQSAPGGGAGGNLGTRWATSGRPRFNPPPAVGPGETGADL